MNRPDLIPQRHRVDIPVNPWVVVGPRGVYWIGQADDEAHAWQLALGWPAEQEIVKAKAHGYYAAEASITWKKPT